MPGIFRIFVDGLIEIGEGDFQAVSGALIPEVTAFEKGLVGLRIDNSDVFQRGLFLGIQIDADLIGDSSGDLILERQRVAQFALVALRPQVLIGGGFDQLRGDTDAVAGAEDGAFDDCVDVEFASDLRKGLARVLVGITEVREMTRRR